MKGRLARQVDIHVLQSETCRKGDEILHANMFLQASLARFATIALTMQVKKGCLGLMD